MTAPRVLSAFVNRLEVVQGSTAGQTPSATRAGYLRAVEDAEWQMHSLVDGEGWRKTAPTDRYWRIREIGDGSARPIP